MLPVLVPVEDEKISDNLFSAETISDQDLYWYCNIFRANEVGQYIYSGLGYHVEPLSDHTIEYNPDVYEYRVLPLGDYLYGMGSVAGNYAGPSVMERFLDYAKDHNPVLENTADSGIYFVNRNNAGREYFYDVTIPINK